MQNKQFPQNLDLLSYDKDTGLFAWAKDYKRVKEGQTAGSKDSRGYIGIKVSGKRFLAHRLAWLVSYGTWPDGEIDHINRIRTDNRIANLRVVDSSKNGHNKFSATRRSKSGALGVSMRDGKFRARICINKKQISLGDYLTAEEAEFAYLKAKSEVLA